MFRIATKEFIPEIVFRDQGRRESKSSSVARCFHAPQRQPVQWDHRESRNKIRVESEIQMLESL